MSENIAILGAGVSGQAARRLVESFGDSAVVFDQTASPESIAFEASALDGMDAVVISPGFEQSHPWREIAESSGISCWGELGYAARYWKGKIIAVTGTNGKTTVTEFLAKALNAAGLKAVAAGNIGYTLSDAVLSEVNSKDAYAVVEVSSFQAELPRGLELDALVWTNFAEDHLDRYSSMKDYFDAKAKLFDCLVAGAPCVLGSQVVEWLRLMKSEFSSFVTVKEDSLLIDRLDLGSPFKQFPQSENFSLGAKLWSLLGLPADSLLETANSFELAPHRLKCETTRRGVSFWNDSKATNFHATLAALTALSEPIYWIGGGQTKGGDLRAFAQKVASFAKVAYVYGEAGAELAVELKNTDIPVFYVGEFQAAVMAAAKAADCEPSANVLLSPGFSSFDQFSSYEERGKCFINTVLGLNDANAPR
ncbi:MAG: UDP-N-acetylmuramoyl-L-alanine--D-glutamate ligase [Opitutaceae bacterium]